MSLQLCSDTSEAVVLEETLGLYLKPVSKIKINVQIPKLKDPGQSISSWNAMEKLKETVRPDQFLTLKSLKITANVIKFEGELETKASAERALARLRAAGSLKLSGFTEKFQLRAAHAPCSGPTRHDWEAFYRDAKGVNEMKPGERPDTIHLQDIPVHWFCTSSKPMKVSEKMLKKAFATFGRIRRLEILSTDNMSSESTFQKKSSLHNDLLFETYIQYEEYVEFSIAMDSLRGKKLLYKDADGKVFSANVKVDFDRTNYLSERCINKRASECKKVNVASTETSKCEISSEIKESSSQVKLKEEKPTETEIKSPNKEAVLLLKELFQRVEKSEKSKEKKCAVLKCLSCQKPVEANKRKKEEEESDRNMKKEKLIKEKLTKEKLSNEKLAKEKLKNDKLAKEKLKNEKLAKEKLKNEKLYLEKRQKEKLIEQEHLLKEKLLQKMRLRELQKVAESREKRRKDLAGRKALKSVLAVKKFS